MPMVEVAFPTSSQPGALPGQGQGRLLNWFFDALTKEWKPCPGFSLLADTTLENCRGMIDINGVLYVCMGEDVLTITTNGVITVLTGTVSGDGPVTWARNNKSPLPDVVLCNGTTTYTVTATDVTTFADPDWPSMRCVFNVDGYIGGLTGSAQVWLTGLNDITVSALSFEAAQSNPDDGQRAVAYGRQAFIFGPASCEIYVNAGLTPFPFQRQEVITVGLLGQWAIAGMENGWDGPLIFVASDGTVRRMDGYAATPISNDDVNRAIQSVINKDTLHAKVHVVGGHPIWSLTSLTWTWEYHLRSGLWHERKSYGEDVNRWRAEQSCKFDGSWIVGDILSTKLFRLAADRVEEDGAPLVRVIESGPTKEFPSRIACSEAHFDFSTGQGSLLGTDDEVNPKVTVQWSLDGGANWSNGINVRSLGSLGQYDKPVRVNRIGLSTGAGLRFRLTTSSPVQMSLRGGRAMVTARKAA